MKIAAALVGVGLVVAAAAPGAVWAQQVTFRSLEVLGVSDAARADETPDSPTMHFDGEVRFFSDDGRRYWLDAFGCLFEFYPLRAPFSEADLRVVETVKADFAAYRVAVRGNLVIGGELREVTEGELVLAGAGSAAEERYGLKCEDGLVTAVSLDVLRNGGTPRLRLLILQTAEGEAAAPSRTIAMAVMESVIFGPSEEDELAEAGALTQDIFHALTQ